MIVFIYMREWCDNNGEAFLNYQIYNTEEELFEEELGSKEEGWGFMSEGLKDILGNPVSEDMMKEILTGGYNGFRYWTEDRRFVYTFAVTNIKLTVTL